MDCWELLLVAWITCVFSLPNDGLYRVGLKKMTSAKESMKTREKLLGKLKMEHGTQTNEKNSIDTVLSLGLYNFLDHLVKCDLASTLPNISFNLDGKDFTLQGSDYVLENEDSSNEMCLVALHDKNVEPLWRLGTTFIKKFYTEFD